MLNLRDLIFSQSQSQSQPLSQLEPLLQPLPLSHLPSSAAAIDDSDSPVYDDDEYIDDLPDGSERQTKTTSRKRKSSRYGNDVPLMRTNARHFSKIYATSPELLFFKPHRLSNERIGKSNEVRAESELS
jgi:hypothetical protein